MWYAGIISNISSKYKKFSAPGCIFLLLLFQSYKNFPSFFLFSSCIFLFYGVECILRKYTILLAFGWGVGISNRDMFLCAPGLGCGFQGKECFLCRSPMS